METEEVKEEITETKPLKKRSLKATSGQTEADGEPKTKIRKKISKTGKTGKTKSKTKASTARRKKAAGDEDIIINLTEEALDSNAYIKEKEVSDEVIDIFEGSEPQPTGQAVVSSKKVEVLASTSSSSGSQLPTAVKSNDSSGTKIATSSIPATSVLAGNTQLEAVQVGQLPFFAVKVRNVIGKLLNVVAEIIPNKVIVQGLIHDQVFFVGNDGIVHHMAGEGHFSTFVDIPGVQPGMNAQATAVIEDIIVELAPDGLSVTKKIIIEVFVKVTESAQLGLLPGTGPTLLLPRVVGENSAQTLIETDVTLFTPAVKIDEIVGTITNVTVETITDKVIIQGILHKQIFFIDTADTGRHQAEEIPFSLFVDIPGAAPGMDVEVSPRIEAIFFNLISPTVVRQKAVLEFFVKVTESILQTVTLGNGPLFKVEEFVGENTNQELVETVITLNTPAIKIREITAKLQNIVTNIIPNKVIVQGVIHKQVFFIGTDNIEHHQAEDIPVSLFLDIPGAAPGENVHLTTKIEGIFFDLLSSFELRQKVIFAVTAVITQEIQANLVVGIGPLFKLEQVVGENTKQVLAVLQEAIVSPVTPVKPVVTKVTVVTPAAAVVAKQQVILTLTFQLPVTAIKIKEITAIATGVTFKVVPDGVLVEGTLDKTITFVGTDNIVRSINEQAPFSILVKVPGVTPGQITNVTVTVEDVIFSLNASGTAVNQTVILLAQVEGSEQPGSTFQVVTDVSGPGVIETKVAVQGLILTPSGAVFQQFEAVTDVSGPGILKVTKQTVMLQRVGDPAPTPITVVTDVQIADP